MRPTLSSRAALAVTISIFVAACSSVPSPTGSPGSMTTASPAALPSLANDASPTASAPGTTANPTPASGGAIALATDSIAKVVTDGLRLRTLPRVAADSEKLEPLLRRGEQVYVVDGPTRASGFDWYLVRPLRLSTYPPGWVAAADHDGTPWLAQATVDCPANPDFGQLVRMERHVALVCYGHREFRLEGLLTQPIASCGIGFDVQPEWIGDCGATHDLAVNEGHGNPGYDDTPVLDIHLSPEVDRQARIPDQTDGKLLRAVVVGAFDNPAARSCRAPPEDGVEPAPRPVVVLGCRISFVGTSAEPVGGRASSSLAKPVLAAAGTRDYSANGGDWTGYEFSVVNWYQFPKELFASAADLPACGASEAASRTWVEIWDAEYDARLYGFCGLHDPATDLDGLWFAVPRGEAPPASVYVTFIDRLTWSWTRSDPVKVTPR